MLAIVAVIIIAGLGVGVVLLLGRPTTPPAGASLDHVTVSVVGGSTTLDQGSALTLSAAAFDTNGKDVSSNSTFAWSATPAGSVSISHPGVSSSALVTAVQGGSSAITATATWNGASKSATTNLTINPLHFYVTASFYHPLVGTPIVLTVRVAHADNTTATTFTGIVHFTSTDPTATLPPAATFSPSDAGVKTFTNVTINMTGSVQITATNTTYSITGSTTVYGNAAPVASFTAAANATNPHQVLLDASASADSDGDTLSYSWDFGDGNTSNTGTPKTSWTYGAAGTYTITLTVYDTYNANSQATASFTAHTAPTSSFKVVSESKSTIGVEVEFSAAASTGGDGTITSYAWQFGDSSTTTVATATVFHNYTTAYDGTNVTVNLTVTNNYSFTDLASKLVPVSSKALPPIASFTMSIDNYTRTVSVDGSSSYTPTGQAISWYNWNWGDGSAVLNTSSPTASHQYAADGTYTITLTVVNSVNYKDTATAAAPVVLKNVPPVAIFTVSRNFMNASVDASQTYDLNGNLAWFTWNWGDGSAAQTFPSSTPTAKHLYVKPGLYTITLTANDTTNLKGTTTRYVSVSNATLDYTYYDFFNVPYGEWWDMRTKFYGDLPPNAQCFNATSITTGRCALSKTSTLPKSETFPYTDWYPAPFGSLFWQQPGDDPFIYAPYRINVTGQEVPHYNLSQPVFLPIMNYAAQPGKLLQFRWNMQYLTTASATALTNAGCSGVAASSDDGFMIRSQIYLTMDWQEAKRIFGVPVSDNSVTAIQNYFDIKNTTSPGQINPACGTTSNLETWFANQLANEGNGKYDIWNAYQFPYTPLYTNFSTPIVSPAGTIQFTIDMAAWGTEALMSRWFYWGNASYQTNVLDSTKAQGWWGMELAWFEDFHFAGDLNAAAMNFSLQTAMMYHFQMGSLPGPDKCLRTQTTCTERSPSDDVPYWQWGPFLSDYVAASSKHPTSELSRWTGLQYLHSTPGASNYGQLGAYDYGPDSWPARAGEQWHFIFPVQMMFYNPQTVPIPANPQGQLLYWDNAKAGVAYNEYNTTPANYGVYNGTTWVWDVAGNGPWLSYPSGWPDGAPRSYPNIPWGAIIFVPADATLALASPAVVALASTLSSGGTTTSVSSGVGIVSAAYASTTWLTTLAALPARSEFRPYGTE